MSYSVSVIMPIYNSEATFARAINSLKKQTLGLENIELIIIDDNSTDDSLKLAKSFAEEHSNVKVFQTEGNSGAGAARDFGLSKVIAPFVMFLDSDDELETDACETLLFEIESSGTDLVSGCYREICENGRIIGDIPTVYYDAREGDYDLCGGIAVFQPLADPFWCKIYRTDIIRKNNICFGGRYTGEDTIFFIRYLLCCKTARYLKKSVYRYYMSDNSLSHSKSKEYFLRVADCYDDMYSILKKAGQLTFFDMHMNADYFLHQYSVTEGFSEEDNAEILKRWWKLLEYTAKHKLTCHSPEVRVIVRDADRNNFEAAVFHLNEFRVMEDERRTQLNDIFSSNTWKLSQKLIKLFRK